MLSRTKSFIALVGALVLCASSARADETPADDGTMAEARKQFHAGVNLLDDPDGARYEEAYHAFQKAYALSKSPKVLGNIGFCSLKLERDGEAIDAYAAYLRDSHDVDARERAQIEKDLATLTSTVVTYKATVKLPPNASRGPILLQDTRIQTRGSPVVNTYVLEGPVTVLRLRPGRHSIKMKVGEAESIVHEVSLETATQAAHEFTFAPPRPPATIVVESKPSYAGPLTFGILGVAALGTGAVTGIVAQRKTKDIEASCPDNVCPATYDLDRERKSTKTFSTIADATLIGGGVALAGALVWAIALPSGKRRTGAGWSPNARCGTRECGVSIEGRF
jgi:hypothetical protein